MFEVCLRKINSDDKNLLFEWRNLNELVALSYFKNKVTLIEHTRWFNQKLISTDSDLNIIQLNNTDIGLIRIEMSIKGCEVSIYLIPGNEGKGYGYKALSMALSKNKSCSSFYANVQLKNISSQKLFLKLKFKEVSRDNEFIFYQKK